MSKHKKLTNQEVVNYKFNPSIIQYIEQYIHDTRNSKDDIRILDYGSGRGQAVAVLRNMGYSAYGVEIDPIPFNNGLDYFVEKGYMPNEFLYLVSDDCKTDFDSNYFDIVFSDQVFEHLRDIEKVVKEISRITKEGGVHVHIFPAKWKFIEPHLFMPIIHWLPKNEIRKWIIFIYVKLGIEPYWDALKNYPSKAKAEVYYKYSIEKTFYRSIDKLNRVLNKYGFIARHRYNDNYGKGIYRIIKRFLSSQVKLELTKISLINNTLNEQG